MLKWNEKFNYPVLQVFDLGGKLTYEFKFENLKFTTDDKDIILKGIEKWYGTEGIVKNNLELFLVMNSYCDYKDKN